MPFRMAPFVLIASLKILLFTEGALVANHPGRKNRVRSGTRAL